MSTVDPNRMDIDPPELSTSSTADSAGPGTPSSFTTAPTGTATTSPAADGAKTASDVPHNTQPPAADSVGAEPIPSAEPSASAFPPNPPSYGSESDKKPPPQTPSTSTFKGKEKEKETATSTSVEPEEPLADISHVPPPDLQALLSKSRDPGAHIDASRLAVLELQALLQKAVGLKAEGNKCFTSKPPSLTEARDKYLAALDCLPAVPKHLPPPSPHDPQIREISDEEAELIEADYEAGPMRVAVENDIRDAEKALWGNLGAVYGQQKLYKEEVDACTRALAFDPHYIKALHRRASANEHIGTWSALVSAKRDCDLLMTLLPPDSSVATNVAKALDTLPKRISAARQREEAEVQGKMDGLSTN